MDDDGCTVPMLLQYKDISSLLYSIQYTIYLAGFLLFLLTVLLSCCGGEGVGSSTYLSPHLHSFFYVKLKVQCHQMLFSSFNPLANGFSQKSSTSLCAVRKSAGMDNMLSQLYQYCPFGFNINCQYFEEFPTNSARHNDE